MSNSLHFAFPFINKNNAFKIKIFLLQNVIYLRDIKRDVLSWKYLLEIET
jgi:hypothetical protein